MSSEPQPLKKFGQHFLSNPHTLQRMLDEISPAANESFIEIGPGTGALTFPLSRQCQSVTALEIDERMLKFIADNMGTSSNIQLIKTDALKDDLASIFNKINSQNIKEADTPIKQFRLVGNLPYNISVHLIEKFLILANFGVDSDINSTMTDESKQPLSKNASNKNPAHLFNDMHFLVQKEIAQRLFAKVGDSNYGRLSIMIHVLAEGSKLFNLPPGDFSPPPKVTSSFIQIQPRLHSCFSKSKAGVDKLRQFNKLIASSFTRPNRRMRNNLKNYPSIIEILMKLNLDNKRAREISPEDFISIINLIELNKDISIKD